MLFFKTFLLPYFDYCLSLIIYFSKTAINNLAKIYYLCLYKLFNFNFNNSNTHQINSRLNFFSLSSFEYRCTYKFFDFSYNIKHNRLAPKELSAILRENAVKHDYGLRSTTLPVVAYGDFTSSFGTFFSNFYNKIDINKLIYQITKYDDFILAVNNNISNIIDKFISIFPKFNIFVNFNHFCLKSVHFISA